MTGFVAFEQQVFGVGEELSAGRNYFAGRNCLLLAHAGEKKYEVRRRYVLPQNQSPLAIGRKRVGRLLTHANGGRASGIAGIYRIVAAAGLAGLDKQQEFPVIGDVNR